MYGWINGTLEEWVKQYYGNETWDEVVATSQVEVPPEGFFRNVYYSDDGLFQLIRAVSVLLNLDCEELIFDVGRHFIHYLENHGYSRTLRCQGSNFREWLHNINEPHRILRYRFPNAIFPNLWCEKDVEDATGRTFLLHYLSKRRDVFVPLFKGILTEAALYYFKFELNMSFVSDEALPETGEYHAIFRVADVDHATEMQKPLVTEKKASSSDGGSASAECPFRRMRGISIDSPGGRSRTHSLSGMSISPRATVPINTAAVGMSPSIFKHLFPFHIVIDRHLNITQLGDKLEELVQSTWCIPHVLRHPIADNFDIACPKFVKWNWEELCKLNRSPIEIVLKTMLEKPASISPAYVSSATASLSQSHTLTAPPDDNDFVTVRFRGELVVLDEQDADKIALCLNPDLMHMDQLFQLRMRLADLPCHSFQAELLLVDEHLKTETNYTLTLKEISTELDRETKRATKALQLKRHFVRYVSHEIRTPLNIAILGLRFLEQAMNDPAVFPVMSKLNAANELTKDIDVKTEEEGNDLEDESLPVVVSEVKSAAEMAVDILNDLLLYEKVDNSGIFELSEDFYDVHNLVHESLHLFRIQAKGANVKFTVNDSLIIRASNDGSMDLPVRYGYDFHHQFKKSPLSLSSALSTTLQLDAETPSLNDDCYEPVMVKADRSKIQQVLRNLFTNAVKFTSAGKAVNVAYAVFGSIELLMKHRQAVLDDHARMVAAQSATLPGSPHSPKHQISLEDLSGKSTDGGLVRLTSSHVSDMGGGLVPQSLSSSFRGVGDVADAGRNGSEKRRSLQRRTPVPGSPSAANGSTASGEAHLPSATATNVDPSINPTVASSDTEAPTPVVVHFAEDVPHFPPFFVRIAVQDEGAGITDHDQRTLFHEFIQLKADKLQNGQGSGLGLWIASSIMHLHKGRIGVVSEGEGRGSTFLIDIPISVFDEKGQEVVGVLIVGARSHSNDLLEAPSQTIATTASTERDRAFNVTVVTSVPPPPSALSQHPGTDGNTPPRSPFAQHVASSISEPSGDLHRHLSQSLSPSNLRSSSGSFHRSPRLLGNFPRSPGAGMRIYTEAGAPEAVRERLPPLQHPSFTSCRVLMVDDAASNRKMVKRSLQKTFPHIEEAENGQVAVDKFLSFVNVYRQSQQSSDLIGVVLMDLFMPIMDGVEATRQIKQQAEAAGVEVLIFGVTGQGLMDDVRLFKAAGADEVFVKPLDTTKMLHCLQTVYGFAT